MKTNYTQQVVEAVLQDNVIKATKYISPKEIVRATRKTFRGKIDKRGNIEITLTIGRPNYLEREFIKLCKRAKESFPTRNVQLKLYNPKKKKLKRGKIEGK